MRYYPHYTLALILEGQGRQEEADALFLRATTIANAFGPTTDPVMFGVMQRIVDARAAGTAEPEPVPAEWLRAIAAWKLDQGDVAAYLKHQQMAVDRISEESGTDSLTALLWRTDPAETLYAEGRVDETHERPGGGRPGMTQLLDAVREPDYARFQLAGRVVEDLAAHDRNEAAEALALHAAKRMEQFQGNDFMVVFDQRILDALEAADLDGEAARLSELAEADERSLIFESPEEPVVVAEPAPMGGSLDDAAMRGKLLRAQDAIRANLGKAGVAYNAPETMQFGEVTAVELVLAPQRAGSRRRTCSAPTWRGVIETATGLNVRAQHAGDVVGARLQGRSTGAAAPDGARRHQVELDRRAAPLWPGQGALSSSWQALPVVAGLDVPTIPPIHVETFRRKIVVDVDPWSRAVSMADDVKAVHATVVAVGGTLLAIGGWAWRRRRAAESAGKA